MTNYLKYKGAIYRSVDAEWNTYWLKADDLRSKAQNLLFDAIRYYGMAADKFQKEGDGEKAKEAKAGENYYNDIARKLSKRSF